MSVKVSQMPLAESVGDGDLLMIVQNGQSKKIPATQFQQTSEPISNALTLEGYGADEFVKKGETATDSDALGGKNASEYATKNYVDGKTGKNVGWNWCCPQLWFSKDVFPKGEIPSDSTDPNQYGISAHFALCAGQWLSEDEYPELGKILAHAFDSYQQEGYFQLPDLRGRFALGVEANQMKSTKNLPNGLYNGAEGFTTDGQWKYPKEVGKKGGDPTTTQDSTWQMANHRHKSFDENGDRPSVNARVAHTGTIIDYTEMLDKNPSVASGLDEMRSLNSGYSGSNEEQYATPFPNDNFNPNHFNYGMLSMPPFLTFAYIMQIKPFEE